MKTMRKFASLALALILTLALAAPAFAQEVVATEGGSGEITVTNPAPNQTYKLYRIFDLESFKAAGKGQDKTQQPHSYTITSDSPWFGLVKPASGEGETAGPAAEYVELTAYDDTATPVLYYVTWVQGADVEAFAKAAILWAEGSPAVPEVKDEEGNVTTPAVPAVPGHISEPIVFGTAGTAAAAPTEDDPDPRAEAITFKGLNLGYYLISSTRGTLCALDTTNSTASVTEKNAKPTVDKEAVELPDGIGDSIEYKVTVHAKKGAEKYVVHDTMSKGLSFNNDVVVKVGDTTVDAANYTVNTTTTDNCTFEVIFTQTYLDTLTADTTDIVITYSATVTAAAVEVDTVNNTAKLTFNNETTPEETLPDPVDVKLYEFDLVKTNTTNEMLAGAIFELYRKGATPEEDVLMQLVKVSENVYRPVAKDKDGNITDAETGIVTTVTTDATGKITFKGLGLGTYYLHETEAPAGYNKLKDDREVKIEAPVKDTEGNITSGGSIEAKYTDGVYVPGTGIQVINKNGLELPETGGIGTTIFYVVGGLLVVGAGVLLVTKKRMSGEEE